MSTFNISDVSDAVIEAYRMKLVQGYESVRIESDGEKIYVTGGSNNEFTRDCEVLRRINENVTWFEMFDYIVFDEENGNLIIINPDSSSNNNTISNSARPPTKEEVAKYDLPPTASVVEEENIDSFFSEMDWLDILKDEIELVESELENLKQRKKEEQYLKSLEE